MPRKYIKKLGSTRKFQYDPVYMERAVAVVANGRMSIRRASEMYATPTIRRFMRPLSLYYKDEIRKWLRSHPGKVAQLFDVSSLFSQAFLNAANMRRAIKGLEKSGIWPPNLNIFTDNDFLPAETTDIPLENPAERTTQETPTAAVALIPFIETLEDFPISAINSLPVSEIPENAQPSYIRVDTVPSTKTLQIHPIPVTDNFPIQENLLVSTSDENVASPVRIHVSPKPGCSWMSDSPRMGRESEESSEDEDAICLYCLDLYSKSTEGWCSCSICEKWAHLSCAGLDSDDDESVLISELCQ
ncbi:hypothetical protein RN001_004260 [Aquatica leii]|uniref:Zinc finger PHD-type domain-containing protein n=1 Tax=Aquatica leii TaxID=1421715 RepID=A0AAN7PI44_9COLE|nr:hypothetical protein RN001_004260 [Aquatica leii]